MVYRPRAEALTIDEHSAEPALATPDAGACVFCGEPVEPTPVDPCRLTLESADGAVNWFTCHAACIGDAAHPSIWFPELGRR